MPPKVYIPLIVSGRDKYQYHATSCGCFRTREQAINSFVRHLVDTCFVSFDFFQDSLEDRIENLKSNSDNIKIADEISKLENITTEEDFIEYLTSKVDGNFDSLVEICRTYGDSYYEDGWKIQIDEHDLM